MFLGIGALTCFISIRMFVRFKNPFVTINSLLKLRMSLFSNTADIFLWCMLSRWFPWAMAATSAAKNHGGERWLTWYSWWGIYTSISTWIHLQNSAAASETPSLKICSHGTSLKWLQRSSQSAWKWPQDGNELRTLVKSAHFVNVNLYENVRKLGDFLLYYSNERAFFHQHLWHGISRKLKPIKDETRAAREWF